jgi:hypothetical protein
MKTPKIPGRPSLPSRKALKDQAKRLRHALEQDGNFVSHSEALEILAQQHGWRDWNTLSAALGNRPVEPIVLGQAVQGRYLGQNFNADVIGISRLGDGSRYRVTLDLEQAVDVVTFDSFSAFRKRISGTIGTDGKTRERTSNGQPQLEIHV